MGMARLVRLAPCQESDGHGHDADEKHDTWGQGRLPLVAAFLGRNHHQGQCDGRQGAEDIEANHEGLVWCPCYSLIAPSRW